MFDRIVDAIQKGCVYGVISCLALLLFVLTYNAGAYGASAMVIVLLGFVLYVVVLNYRR